MNFVETYVQELYRHLHITSPHQLTPAHLAEKLQIQLFYWEESSQSLISHGTPYIFLNRSPFFWEEFCHELGHILLHSGNQQQLPSSFVKFQEFKANNFSLHAAIPTFMLQDLNTSEDRLTIFTLQQLFHVSPSFAQKRLDHYINNHIHATQLQ